MVAIIHGKTPRFVGVSFKSSGTSQNLTLDYPANSAIGDALFAWVVSDAASVPVANGWTTLYSNTTTAVSGPGSGRALLYRKRGGETNSTIVVVGGGNASCAALRDFNNKISGVKEFVANSTFTTNSSFSLSSTREIFLTFVNHDGATQNPTISIANSNTTISNVPGDFRSMAVAFKRGVVPTGNVVISISAESGYGASLTVI